MTYIIIIVLVVIGVIVLATLEALFVGLLEVVTKFLAATLEFVYLALTQGISTASQQFKKRMQERTKHPAIPNSSAGTPETDEATPTHSTQFEILKWIVLFLLAGCVMIPGYLHYRSEKQHRTDQEQRVKETRSQVKQLADTFTQQIKDKNAADPIPGSLRDLDAWQRPIKLRVDKELLSSEIAVRSWGPDRVPGSSDDIVEERTIRVSAKEAGSDLAKRGVKAVRNRIVEMLPGGKKEQQPEEPDNGGEENKKENKRGGTLK
ncbi:hypothetical protein Pan241w_20530 [Gimesia alba]|uniref:Uncharacterized protein n=1 Tax=Gimesia alba TaxID=2527973 RepID=A0A517RDP7_9PLAN|nr:hypothetical protein [Gimesia alba]QDT41973.1 hypothetical protein Pan241w_20530 [Gimesia alba]